jgi:DNA polymerase delta subunit 1
MIILPPEPGVVTPENPDDEWKARRMKYVFDTGAKIGEDITSRLRHPLELELEGVLYPAAYYKKKNYAAVLWENPVTPEPKMKMRGVVAVRNDWSRLTKRIATTVLNMGIRENDPEGAFQFLRDTLTDMRKGKLPVEDFVLSKELHDLSPKTISPHVALCKRLMIEDPMNVPVLGTKVEYVIVKGPKELYQASRRPEDVTSDQLDFEYYFEKQILKPLTALLAPLVDGGEAKLRRILTNEQNRMQTIFAAWGLGERETAVTKKREVLPQSSHNVKKQKTLTSFFK